MNRRDFLTQIAPATTSPNRQIPSPVSNPTRFGGSGSNRGGRKVLTTTGLEHYTGTWAYDQAAHLLRRTMFGAAKADVDTILKGTLDQAVDLLLTQPAAPAPPLVYYQKDGTLLQDQT
jgi:hypothetical protein